MRTRWRGAGVGGSGAANLAAFPGLVRWCKADGRLTRDGSDNVSPWGEPGYDEFTQSVVAKKFKYVADDGDGLPACRCDGIDDWMTSASQALTSYSYIIIARNSTTGVGPLLLQHGDTQSSGYGDPGFYLHTSTVGTVATNRGGVNAYSDHTANWHTDSAYRLISVTYDGLPWVMRVNGSPISLAPGDASDPGVASLSKPINIGGFDGIDIPTGAFREVGAYTPALSSADVIAAEIILNNYWSVY